MELSDNIYNKDVGRDEPKLKLWRSADLLEKAPLLAFARKQGGYKKSNVYANQYHLCTSVRKFLFNKGLDKSIIGPQELYNS